MKRNETKQSCDGEIDEALMLRLIFIDQISLSVLQLLFYERSVADEVVGWLISQLLALSNKSLLFI